MEVLCLIRDGHRNSHIETHEAVPDVTVEKVVVVLINI